MKKLNEFFHIKTAEVPLYNGILVIIVSNSIDKIKKYLPDFPEDVFAHSINCEYKENQGFYVVLNPDKRNGTLDHGIIAHEAHHIAGFIAMYSGILPSFENDEPTAYLVGWVVNKIYELLNYKNIKII